eukprot:PhM_4_TR17053/c0_g1_i1/m.18457
MEGRRRRCEGALDDKVRLAEVLKEEHNIVVAALGRRDETLRREVPRLGLLVLYERTPRVARVHGTHIPKTELVAPCFRCLTEDASRRRVLLCVHVHGSYSLVGKVQTEPHNATLRTLSPARHTHCPHRATAAVLRHHLHPLHSHAKCVLGVVDVLVAVRDAVVHAPPERYIALLGSVVHTLLASGALPHHANQQRLLCTRAHAEVYLRAVRAPHHRAVVLRRPERRQVAGDIVMLLSLLLLFEEVAQQTLRLVDHCGHEECNDCHEQRDNTQFNCELQGAAWGGRSSRVAPFLVMVLHVCIVGMVVGVGIHTTCVFRGFLVFSHVVQKY